MGLFGRTGGNGRHAKGGKNYRPQATSRGRKKASQYGPLGNPFPSGARSRFMNAKVPAPRVGGSGDWFARLFPAKFR